MKQANEIPPYRIKGNQSDIFKIVRSGDGKSIRIYPMPDVDHITLTKEDLERHMKFLENHSRPDT